jgi:N-acetylneuraminic acid mutarotase
VDCLHYQENDRPSSEELCQRLAGLKESREYRESTHQIQDEVHSNSDQVFLLTQQLQEKDIEVQEKDRQILEKDRLLQQQERMLREKDDEILRRVQEKDRVLQQKDNEIQDRDRLLQQNERQLQEERATRERRLQEERATQGRQLRLQLEEQEQVTAEIQQTNHSLQRRVEQLQQQLSQQSLKPPQPPPPSQAQVRGRQLQERESRKQLPVQPSLQVDHKPHPHRVRKMSLNWRDGGKAPLKMRRGAAVVDGDVAYFINWYGEVCSYNVFSTKWSKLPKCPYCHSSLAVINGQVTIIGGCKDIHNKDTYTNKLLSLPGYKEVFPAMPTKRRGTTAVTSKEHLIVAGGAIGFSDKLNIVEVMDIKSLVWSIVASLPHPGPYSEASWSILCGDQLYMLGGYGYNGQTKSVLTCSLTELLQSSSSSSSSIWYRVTDAPAYLSTCAAVNGELLAVGGCDKDDKPSSAIHKYNPTTNSWDLISNTPTARWHSLVAVLPTNEMMVVGGSIKGRVGDIDTIEITNLINCFPHYFFLIVVVHV